jgi:hypothetical protein
MNTTVREQMIVNLMSIKRDLYGIRNLSQNESIVPRSFQPGIMDLLAQAFDICQQIQSKIENIG